MIHIKLLPSHGRNQAQAILACGGGETSSLDTLAWLVKLAKQSGTEIEFHRDTITYSLDEMEIALQHDIEVRPSGA